MDTELELLSQNWQHTYYTLVSQTVDVSQSRTRPLDIDLNINRIALLFWQQMNPKEFHVLSQAFPTSLPLCKRLGCGTGYILHPCLLHNCYLGRLVPVVRKKMWVFLKPVKAWLRKNLNYFSLDW